MRYKATIRTLSPLHIGSGVELLGDYDYKSLENGDETVVFNQDAIYARELARHGENANLAQPAASLIHDLKNLPDEFKRYTLHGQASLERLHEQMKDVYGGVYLPGSSLKGAIRNALMTYAVTKREFSVEDLNENSKEAAKRWESEIFGNSPWSDVLRALQVADSRSINPPSLEVVPIRVFVSTKDDKGTPIEVEAVSTGTIFDTSINLDELTLQYANDHRLDWADRLSVLANVLPILQMVGKRRIESELATAQERGFLQVVEFYEGLYDKIDDADNHNSAFLQIGWGTGWKGMTIGEALDKPVVDHLRSRYELGKPPAWKDRENGPWQPDIAKSFPKSHRYTGDKIPQRPLGWVKITLEQDGAPRLKNVWDVIQKAVDKGVEPMGKFASVQDFEITTPEPTSTAASGVPSGITWIFSLERLPQPGDIFESKVLTDGETYILSFTGLDPDTEAYGDLREEDNPNLSQIKDGQHVRAEVLEVQQGTSGALHARCKVLHMVQKRG